MVLTGLLEVLKQYRTPLSVIKFPYNHTQILHGGEKASSCGSQMFLNTCQWCHIFPSPHLQHHHCTHPWLCPCVLNHHHHYPERTVKLDIKINRLTNSQKHKLFFSRWLALIEGNEWWSIFIWSETSGHLKDPFWAGDFFVDVHNHLGNGNDEDDNYDQLMSALKQCQCWKKLLVAQNLSLIDDPDIYVCRFRYILPPCLTMARRRPSWRHRWSSSPWW